MKETEFNLLDEPWIRVRRSDCSVTELSLTDTLLHAHEYEDLAGELPTQDIAIMRVLLAVLHTVFSRVNIEGQPDPLDEDNALERWGELWNLGKFSEKPILDYLKEWHERFWLFHPERPFFQVPEAVIGTEYSAPKLIGDISESSNKVRLFSSRFGDSKQSLSYSESARWLINTNAFDDTSAKPKGKNLPSVGAGWLGKIGLIIAQGRSLYETLMLNLILMKDNNNVWGTSHPIWELPFPRTEERKEINIPDNPAELYTLQSRRLLLTRTEGSVTGFRLLGGDFFQKENAYPYEPMTIWRPILDNKKNPIGFQPLRHDESKQIWRNFPNIVSSDSGSAQPGIIKWINILLDDDEPKIKKSDLIRFKIASVQYGDKDFFISNIFSDFLSFHAGLLTSSGKVWQEQIKDELSSIDIIARLVWRLMNDLILASGGENSEQANRAKELYYFRVNEPFRAWLTKLLPDQSLEEMASLRNEWQRQAVTIARSLGSELIDQTGIQAFSGKKIKDKNEKEHFYSSPEAYNMFVKRLNRVYDFKGA